MDRTARGFYRLHGQGFIEKIYKWEKMTNYELFQLEKYGNILPTFKSLLPITDEPDLTEISTMEEVYIFELENGND